MSIMGCPRGAGIGMAAVSALCEQQLTALLQCEQVTSDFQMLSDANVFSQQNLKSKKCNFCKWTPSPSISLTFTKFALMKPDVQLLFPALFIMNFLSFRAQVGTHCFPTKE